MTFPALPPRISSTVQSQWPFLVAMAFGFVACDAAATMWASHVANAEWLGRCVSFHERGHGRVVAVNSSFSRRNPPKLTFHGRPDQPVIISGVSVSVGDDVVEFLTSDLKIRDCP